MHTCSNAAEIDCTTLTRGCKDHTLQNVLVNTGNFQGGNPWVPPLPAECVCYNGQFRDRAGHKSFTKIMISRFKVRPGERLTLLRAVG